MRIEGSIYHVPKPESDQDKTETDSGPRYTTKYYWDERRPPPVEVVDRVRGTSSEVVNLLPACCLLVAASLGPRFRSCQCMQSWIGKERYVFILFLSFSEYYVQRGDMYEQNLVHMNLS